uniref:Uncharacterized protein n=1 Tax=Vitis vinifera TaxID=29760 RepID=F6HHR7_VITVI
MNGFDCALYWTCDVMKNPANLAKHQANPKVAPVIAKMMAKFAGPK